MGLLDNAMDMFGNHLSQSADPKSQLIQAALGMLTNDNQGGLNGLVERFQQAGLGNVISSWIGTEANVPITPTQIHEALGDEQLQQMADKAGIGKEETASHLSEMLPGIVDSLTPAGHIPAGGLGHMASMLQQLAGRLH